MDDRSAGPKRNPREVHDFWPRLLASPILGALVANVSGLIGRTWRRADGAVSLASSLDVTAFLLEEARVAVVPGRDFGSDAHVRLSYATSDALISEGLARMAAALATLR